jgi:2-oxo-4-hydroxy-4-carboxy-5-ureidoimidazoline decarboxylase
MRTRAQAALNQLRSYAEADPERLGVIGYCFGGGVALELARSGANVKGTAVFHATLDTPPPADAVSVSMAPLRVDQAAAADARALLRTCCGSRRWVERMLQRRPFWSEGALLDAARNEWWALDPDDWKEAFAAHPGIGDREALRSRFADTQHLASREQAGIDGAPEDVLAELAIANKRYEQLFGYIFIVCASGLTADAMLQMLQARLVNDPAAELKIAAGEQARITELRLKQL